MSDIAPRILETLQRDEAFLAALATVDAEGRPHVRYVLARIDEDLSIRCPTFSEAGKVEQIGRDPRVALTCGDTDSTHQGSYYRIEGTAHISTESVERRRAWTARLAKWFSGPDDPSYAVVVVRPTRILALPIGGGPAPQAWEA